MTGINLPGTLAAYFAAQNRHDIDAIVACFTPDARVRDEGEDIVGPEAIRAWKEATGAKYKVTVEPLESRAEAGRTVVVARVSGNFPGSPANLTYRFGLAEDGRISALGIG
ncbi:MAG: nuclear transport factor 2 family protein [Kiloniellaceae bacterium]